jgi:hypothetical protein
MPKDRSIRLAKSELDRRDDLSKQICHSHTREVAGNQQRFVGVRDDRQLETVRDPTEKTLNALGLCSAAWSSRSATVDHSVRNPL